MKGKRLLAVLLSLCMTAALTPWALAAPAGDAAADAASMVSSMTLEQKVGQMLMPAFRTWNEGGSNRKVTALNSAIRDAIRDCGFGGVILFSENTSAGTEATTRLICGMQEAALDSEAGLPLIMSVDQEGGSVVRLGTGTSFCGNMALGAAGDPSLVKKSAAIMGSELAAEGFQLDFAPDMDVNSNPANPVIGIRSFSDEPRKTALYGSAFVAGLHSSHVAAALKHFPGHGDTVTDSHSGLPCINKSMDQLKAAELIPFLAGIQSGADVVMTAHIQYPQIEQTTYTSKADGSKITLPATLSHTIVTDLLRKELGFKGVVCTDAMNMGAIATHFNRMDAARLAINAGVDILLMPVEMTTEAGIQDCRDYIKGIVQMVKDGSIEESTIDAAVTRILTLKEKQGLMDYTVDEEAQVQRALSVVGSKENHDAEWMIANRAITLVKNSNGTLPVQMPEGGKALLFCGYGNEVESMSYGLYQLKAKGFIPFYADYQVINYNKLTSAAAYDSAIAGADAILVSVETSGVSSMDPASASGWQAAFTDDLIARAHAAGKKVCVVSLKLPYDLARYQRADALLAAYNNKGMNGPIIAYDGEMPTYGPNLPAAVFTAFGGNAPTGTLPVNIYALNGQYGYTDTILYPNGYGYAGWDVSDSFIDVALGEYYADPVDWAVQSGITTGISDRLFGPRESCTRAQVVSFLWRAAGCPTVGGSVGFADVSATAYYAPAVKWAVQTGITTGKEGNCFGPNDICTRAQIVTFLARFAGEGDGSGRSGFADVPKNAYYAPSVKWALDNGITTGTEQNRFSPNEGCTRGQVVTFLYRYMGTEN